MLLERSGIIQILALSFRFRCNLVKKFVSALQIIFAKPRFRREMSKSWLISLSGQVLQETPGVKRIFVFCYRFQCNLVKKSASGLFANTFCKSVFSEWVEQDFTHFTLWPSFAGNTRYEGNFSGFLQSSMQSSQTNYFLVVCRYFLQTPVVRVSSARLDPFHSLAKYPRKHKVSTTFCFLRSLNKISPKNLVLTCLQLLFCKTEFSARFEKDDLFHSVATYRRKHRVSFKF